MDTRTFFSAVAGVSIAILSSCSAGEESRNISRFRAAYASSSYDFNCTAQLVTDGIAGTDEPVFTRLLLDGKAIEKEDREWLVDERDFTCFTREQSGFELELQLGEGRVCDHVEYMGQYQWKDDAPEAPFKISLLASEDGKTWETVRDWDEIESSLTDAFSGRFTLVCDTPAKSYKAWRLSADCQRVRQWTFKEWKFFDNGERLDTRLSKDFNSCWISGSAENEWIYVDLGEKSRIEGVTLDWINRPSSGRILVSDDGRRWRKVSGLDKDAPGIRTRGRYVKLELDSTENGEPFCLSEFRVFGKNGIRPRETGWMLARESEAGDPAAWMSATVPGTVLASYIDNGAVPDPYVGDNNRQISESYFLNDFIYRGTLSAPPAAEGALQGRPVRSPGSGERVWLNFDGINWKADVSLNGQEVGHIAGAFTNASFDVTDVVCEGDNEIEVKVYSPAHPGSSKGNTLNREAYNGGYLGADNPTFHASVGWDWIPSIHDRNIGIWNDVYFSKSGDVTVEDPFVTAVLPLPDTTKAVVCIEATLVNHGDKPADTALGMSLGEFSDTVAATIPAGESCRIRRSFTLDNPKLWWPNGYGEQNLYDVRLSVPGDTVNFKTGIRQMDYEVENGHLKMYINGRRFIGRGGNWGFSEATLRYREREYDIAVGLHAAENFNMIRNWVGQTGDEEFFEACDRYGIMIWQDFWLANPADGPVPLDEDMFMQNADNFLRRTRLHPSIALYCGRNEGCPPPTLDKALRDKVMKLDPRAYYIPDSSHGLVGGNGYWKRFTARELFRQWEDRPAFWGQDRFHSEKGMPNMPNYESFVKFIPEEHLWPQDDMWGIHDWTLNSAQSVGTFNAAVDSMFGLPDNAQRFCELAQWVNYDGHRAMFECRSAGRRGLTIWMSHSAWPTTVWCTYDYYYDLTAAFYGCRKANEPLHIMYNPLKECIEVVNFSAGDRKGLVAELSVLDMYGHELSCSNATIDSSEDSTVECFSTEAPDADVYFYKMRLTEGSRVLSENFYVLGRETDNFKALLELPEARLKTSWDGRTLTLENVSGVPAMMVRISAVDAKSGERALPVVCSDNYFHLLPGKKKTVTLDRWQDITRLCPGDDYLSVPARADAYRTKPCGQIKPIIKGFNL